MAPTPPMSMQQDAIAEKQKVVRACPDIMIASVRQSSPRVEASPEVGSPRMVGLPGMVDRGDVPPTGIEPATFGTGNQRSIP